MTKQLGLILLAGFLAAIISINPAAAAELGRVELGGQTIIIHDDNTWEYAGDQASTAPDNCTVVESELVPVSICLDPGEWTRANLSGDHEHKLKRQGVEHYLLVITEKAEFKPEVLRKAILTNAQNAAGLSKVDVLSESTQLVDSQLFNKIVYRTDVDGLDITYTNFYSTFEGTGSVQLVFFALTEDNSNFEPFIQQVVDSLALTN